MNSKTLRNSAIVILLSLSFMLVGSVHAQIGDPSIELYPGGNDPDGLGSYQATSTVFYDQTFTFFAYSEETVCLSSRDGQCSPPAIDDAVRIFVDGSQVYYEESYTHDFGPVDFSNKLHPGSNQVRVQLVDLMGPSRGGSALWLVSVPGAINNTSTQGPQSSDQPSEVHSPSTWSLFWTPSFVLEYDPGA